MLFRSVDDDQGLDDAAGEDYTADDYTIDDYSEGPADDLYEGQVGYYSLQPICPLLLCDSAVSSVVLVSSKCGKTGEYYKSPYCTADIDFTLTYIHTCPLTIRPYFNCVLCSMFISTLWTSSIQL